MVMGKHLHSPMFLRTVSNSYTCVAGLKKPND